MCNVETIGAVEPLGELVRDRGRVIPVGNRTKPALSHRSSISGATIVSMTGLTGMIEYEPSEFTFTAWAGTTIAEIAATLGQRGQYLPFDPMLSEAGATLGGTIGSGIAGPGRQRFGGVRDFLLGAQCVLGDGQIVNVGGRVVKNAAGFDVPKLLVGSAGRLAIVTQATMKVFPQPPHRLTLRVSCLSIQQVVDRIASAAASRWELDAIDYRHDESAILLRLAGPEIANEQLAAAIESDWKTPVQRLESSDSFWRDFNELRWAEGAVAVLRVPLSLGRYAKWRNRMGDAADVTEHLSVAGGVLWLAVTEIDALPEVVRSIVEFDWKTMVVRATDDAAAICEPLIGSRSSMVIEKSIATAFGQLV